MTSNRIKFSLFYTHISPVIEHPLVKSFAPIIFNLVFIAIFIVLAIRPTISAILNLQKTIQENQQTLDALNAKALNLSLGKKNLDNIDITTRNKINLAVPNQPSLPILVSNLEKSFTGEASISGLQVQPVTIFNSASSTLDLTKDGEINFSFNLQGSYTQILAVLAQLKNSPRILSLQSIILSKQDNSSINLSVTGKAYFVK